MIVFIKWTLFLLTTNRKEDKLLKPTMLLIAEKPSERRDYEKAYFNHQSEIPYHIIFTELRGHVDQIPPQKNRRRLVVW